MRIDQNPATIYDLATADRNAEILGKSDPEWTYFAMPLAGAPGKAIVFCIDEAGVLLGAF